MVRYPNLETSTESYQVEHKDVTLNTEMNDLPEDLSLTVKQEVPYVAQQDYPAVYIDDLFNHRTKEWNNYQKEYGRYD